MRGTSRSASAPQSASLLGLVIVAALAGAITGAAASSFGLLLRGVGRLRADFVSWAHHHGVLGVITVLVVPAVAVALAAWLVHRIEPHAEGSGIPRVEAVVEGRAEPGRFRILPVKYLGGLLAIGGGLALGREGPSVQMGGVIATVCARAFRLSRADLRTVVAGGAAAGLATAFNAPIAGGVFVLEELFRRFEARTTLATLSASAAGFAITHVMGDGGTDFVVPRLPAPTLGESPVVLIVGLVCGVLGVAYNKSVMAGLRYVDRSRIPGAVRGVVIGVGVGVLVWFMPTWVGSGDNLTQRALTGHHGVLWLVAVLVATRFVLGVVSYAANTPGGLFAPMLVLGSQTGLLIGLLAAQLVGLPAGVPAALALTGMAAFFASSVQAPVTGLILATEMTGVVSWLAPMLGAVAVAMLVARLFDSAPIYDALAARSARNARINRDQRDAADAGDQDAPAMG